MATGYEATFYQEFGALSRTMRDHTEAMHSVVAQLEAVVEQLNLLNDNLTDRDEDNPLERIAAALERASEAVQPATEGDGPDESTVAFVAVRDPQAVALENAATLEQRRDDAAAESGGMAPGPWHIEENNTGRWIGTRVWDDYEKAVAACREANSSPAGSGGRYGIYGTNGVRA
jgi:hypothetical protein